MTKSRAITDVIIAVMCCICSLSAQTESAKKAFETQDYQKVISEITSNDAVKDDAKSLFIRGISYAELGLANKALSDLARAKTLGLKDPTLYKYLGKTYQLRDRYQEAIKWYKLYLQELPKNSKQDREEILSLVKQCNSAENIPSHESIIVQHCDGDINSIYDELRPIFSRTASNKIYYSTTHQSRSTITGKAFVDGLWSTEITLPSTLNAVGQNALNDISGDGQVLFFTNDQDKKIYSLYNKLVAADKNIFFQAPYFPHLGDKDLQIVDNNTIIFASLRPDSYGGYDIYISKFKAGKWTQPTNLGDEINSAYNEVSPFMTADTKQLYFSSDRLQSLGGYDIFQSTKSVIESKGYNNPTNLGAPINSAGDDLHFRVDGNGLRCTLNSNRNGGRGGLDIYLAYLNTPSSQVIVDASHLDYIKYDNGQIVSNEVEERKPNTTKHQAIPNTSTTAKTQTKTINQGTTSSPLATNKSQTAQNNTQGKTKSTDTNTSASTDPTNRQQTKTSTESEISKVSAQKEKKAKANKEAKRQKKAAKIAKNKSKKEQIEYVDSSTKSQSNTQSRSQSKSQTAQQQNSKSSNTTESSNGSKTLSQPTKSSSLTRMIIPTIYYADEDAIFSIANRDKLDTLAKYFTSLPDDVILELTNFTHKSPRKEYELFFSINQLDVIVEYLVDKGVDKKRLIINSVGSSYPLAEENLGGNSTASDLAMNQRIEATYYNIPPDIKKAQVNLDLPLNRRAKDYPIYLSVKNDVHYRLEFAETSHIFKNRVLNYYNDIIITRDLTTQNYLYALGFFQTYSSALAAQRTLTAKKLPNTEIVAYHGSQRLDKAEVLKLAAKYASLRPFMDKI